MYVHVYMLPAIQLALSSQAGWLIVSFQRQKANIFQAKCGALQRGTMAELSLKHWREDRRK